ncbi:unnamed protein product [Eruca vesicaria subsp. sativa]|uniref:Uncharacterized protein n=1 Tax=Eruca vesicaria subsp. sativa TaxID=29727 RepID=A0ABC8M3M5_ERUVS|nr:unnamed protein product [Eruca vesicaria subsp. sativa]
MLLIDENSAVIQGFVNVNRQFMFKQCLIERSVYRLRRLDVTRSNPNFRMLDASFSIWFNNGTSLVKKTTFIRSIPTELFRFLTWSEV